MDALEKLFHDFVSESRARYIKQDDNHKEVMEKLTGVDVRLENHSSRIRSTEGRIESLEPRVAMNEKFSWGGIAVVTALLAFAGFLFGSIRSSIRIIAQEEIAVQSKIEERVVEKIKEDFDFKE